MKKKITLLYKTSHIDSKTELRFFEKCEDAEKEAKRMIQQFQYWGGGAVPVSANETLWTKNGCRTLKRVEYSENLYIKYARENGNAYGYYRDMHREEKIASIA